MARALRSIGIAVLLAGTVWTGQLLGPRRADAEVYRVVREHTQALAHYLRRETKSGAERLIFLNGNLLRCRLGSTPLRPAELLDRVQALTPAPAVPDLTSDRPHEAIVSAALRQPFRMQGEGWAAFGRLVGGSADDLTPLLPGLADSGRLAPAHAPGFMVLAFADHTSGLTDVWSVEFDDEFDWLNLLRGRDGDVAGGDVPGLPRYPESRRTLTLSEYSDALPGHLVAYRGGGSTDAHVRHYERALRRIGLDPITAERSPGEEALIRAAAGDREVFVFVSPSAEGDSILDLIQVRGREEPT